MFLCHPTITDEELAQILAVVTAVFEEASR